MNDFKYLHPSIQTAVNSYQEVFQPSTGAMTLFQADVFEKGKDGEIDFVGSEEEFLFKYGNPNYEKYGQTGYNIINWLRAGGQALVLRVLPEDATFSHAILNIQSRVYKDQKTLTNADGNLVKMDDVHLRPTVSFLKKNNRHLEQLEAELNKSRNNENSTDGYENNFLLLVRPKGRGSNYNNIGFRLTLNNSMDTSSDSHRVYNFEVLKFDEHNNVNVAEGPFQVSFNPDAETNWGESMYIEEVVNRYSNLVECKFNLDAYIRLAKQINPHVHPASIDVISGTSKVNVDGKPATFYSPITKQNEDTHLSIHKYGSNGELVTTGGIPVTNIALAGDAVQNALISLDNDNREKEYLVEEKRLSKMRELFRSLRAGNGFNELDLKLNSLITVSGDQLEGGELKKLIDETFDEENDSSELSEFKLATETYESNETEENLDAFLTLANSISNTIANKVLDYGNTMEAAFDLVRNSSASADLKPEYKSELSKIIGTLNKKDQVSIFTIEHKNKLFDISKDITSYRIGTATGTNIEGITLISSNLENEYKYIVENLLPVAYDGEEIPESIKKVLFGEDSVEEVLKESAITLSDMKKGLAEDNADNRELIFADFMESINQLVDVINKAVYTSTKSNLEKVINIIKLNYLSSLVKYRKEISRMIKTDGINTERVVLDNARNNIEISLSEVTSIGSKYFNSNLINGGSPVKLMFGSDGSFEWGDVPNNKRRENIKRELVRAYNGSIDTDLLNTKKYPFSVVLDARYPNEVKNAISNLAKESRKDFIFLADTATEFKFPVGPEDALRWRREEFSNSSEYTSIFSQDLVYFDEFNGRDIRVTPTYVLASKIPAQAIEKGLHFPLAGPRRGLISGHKAVSWTPSPAYKEKLYASKVNYIEDETDKTKIGSQLTSIASDGPLSNLNNMFTLIRIKRDVEELVSHYQFEINDDETRNIMYTELNSYLEKYVSNRSCESISADVSATEYDKQRRIVRVRVSVKFNNVIERIFIEIDVQK